MCVIPDFCVNSRNMVPQVAVGPNLVLSVRERLSAGVCAGKLVEMRIG